MPNKEPNWEQTYPIPPAPLESFSADGQRAEILVHLEAEFKRGLAELRDARLAPKARIDKLQAEMHLQRRGQVRWETIRNKDIGTRAILQDRPTPTHYEQRGPAYKINLKEELIYINVQNNHLLGVTAKNTLKLFTISATYTLDKIWEAPGALFVFLLRTGELSFSVLDVLSRVLILLCTKKVPNTAEVFQEFVLFTRATTSTKAFFLGGYLCLAGHFHDLRIFDESLREIPLGPQRKPILASIQKQVQTNECRINSTTQKERTLNLGEITLKIRSATIQVIYAKKSVYEEIHLGKNEQIVFADGVLFLKNPKHIHVLVFK
ncbi:hypothetical protein NEHOM01_2345 [Nematocida homosporus]|uniref:uncharacterized protein n=1 Tax=Nematocida homosporus TaxID=1912981 RepID=UPI00221F80ED|nr:uncharacterized protein NEHOM01_2345 [Nematocida homosporus]KAI5187754.1 hypothetical protein NEHOM01_2345 [Nematocida homosporus]